MSRSGIRPTNWSGHQCKAKRRTQMQQSIVRLVAVGMMMAGALASTGLPAAAGAAAPPILNTPAAAQAIIEREDVATFLDTALPHQMEAEHIAGAAVAVVKDGQLLVAKGYGYADVERQQPVVADRTIF